MKPGVDHIGVTISFFCHDGNGNWLMHQRSQNCRDEQGAWDFGGGTLEFGETLEEGILREISEEYGCQGEIDEQIGVFEKHRVNREGQPTHWIGISYIVRVSPEEARNNEPEKVEQLGWFTIDNLPTPLHSSTQKEFDRLLPSLRKYS